MCEWIVNAESFADLCTGEWTVGQEIVRCKDCRNRKTPDCPLYEIIVIDDGWMEERHYRKIDHTDDDGFCNKGVPTDKGVQKDG